MSPEWGTDQAKNGCPLLRDGRKQASVSCDGLRSRGAPEPSGSTPGGRVSRTLAGRVATLLPRDLPDVLDPESTLRRSVRYRMPW